MIFKLNLVTFLLNLGSSLALNRVERDNQQQEYDSLVLSVNWSPTSACKNILINGSESTCSPCKSAKAVNRWTIHGLWPTQGNGSGPFECQNTPFNLGLIDKSGLKSQLAFAWPSYKGSDDQFWAYEWKKHGTCALDHEDMNSLPKYFSKTLELHNRFNVGEVLDKAGILPSKKYQSKQINRALRKSVGAKVFLACIRNEQLKQQFLHEIHVCLDKSFTPVDCRDKSIYLDDCTNKYEVTYVSMC